MQRVAKVAFATCYVCFKKHGHVFAPKQRSPPPLLAGDLSPHRHLNQPEAPVLGSRISSAITGMVRVDHAGMLWRNVVGYRCRTEYVSVGVIDIKIVCRSVSAV